MKIVSLVLLVILLFSVGFLATACVSPSVTEEGGVTDTRGIRTMKQVKVVGGGYIPGIIFNPSEKDLWYLRTDIGGAYRWDPSSKKWIPLIDFLGPEDYDQYGIASIATDPVEPNRLIIAAGMYTTDWTEGPAEMLVSEDYGETFTRVEMPFRMGGNMPGRGMGERLAIDPNDNRIVYFGSFGQGLWRSRDHGYTWERVESFPVTGNVYDADFYTYVGHKFFYGIPWVVFDPTSGELGEGSKHIYVGVIDTGPTIYESLDGGDSWHPLEGQPGKIFEGVKEHGLLSSNDPLGKYYPVKGIYSPEGALIVAYHAGCGPFNSSYEGGAIWKFSFNTRTWEDISLPPHDPDPSHRTNDRGVGAVAVDWQHPQVLVASTLNEWWPDEILYRSTDGGKTWKPIWEITEWPTRVDHYTLDYSLAPWLDWGTRKAPPEESPKLGWMITALAIDPFNSDVMMYGTGATLYRTENLTAWDRGEKVHIFVGAEGIEETAVLDLESLPEGAPLVSGMGDIGGFVHFELDKAQPMITNPYIGSVSDVDFAEHVPSIIIRMGDGTLGVSRDGGKTWKPVPRKLKGTSKNWGGSAAISADGTTIVWAPPGEEGVEIIPHWSSDYGRTWTPCEGLPPFAKVISDRVNPSRFYAYKDGVWYESTDGARSFVLVNEIDFKVDPSLITELNMRAVFGKEGHLWVAAGKRGLLRSKDGGKTWERIPGVEWARAVGFGKAASDSHYPAVYTQMKYRGGWGVWQSDDEGKTWLRVNDSSQQCGVAMCITGDRRVYGRVYMGTNGRGIVYWEFE
ncbi:glycosyl hydrolase BNR repeat-containing protein [Spirochaeta thermophila DSM 6578]|uniref:Glycosyl hydrolase BNR repeat-containing protein n=2 Tax=Winmispira thermophila TaxID=154 RepID=G0GE25_WINT7|nr:glycosyl hydrolase BNR repeat-containing protein [Spirochaeta thermophila DSM 6578]